MVSILSLGHCMPRDEELHCQVIPLHEELVAKFLLCKFYSVTILDLVALTHFPYVYICRFVYPHVSQFWDFYALSVPVIYRESITSILLTPILQN